MNYSEALQRAKDKINLNSAKILENNSVYYRNRVIELAAIILDETQPLYLYDSRVYEDVANCQDRADHHGVKIGATIKTYRKKKESYYSRYAALLLTLKKEYRLFCS